MTEPQGPVIPTPIAGGRNDAMRPKTEKRFKVVKKSDRDRADQVKRNAATTNQHTPHQEECSTAVSGSAQSRYAPATSRPTASNATSSSEASQKAPQDVPSSQKLRKSKSGKSLSERLGMDNGKERTYVVPDQQVPGAHEGQAIVNDTHSSPKGEVNGSAAQQHDVDQSGRPPGSSQIDDMLSRLRLARETSPPAPKASEANKSRWAVRDSEHAEAATTAATATPAVSAPVAASAMKFEPAAKDIPTAPRAQREKKKGPKKAKEAEPPPAKSLLERMSPAVHQDERAEKEKPTARSRKRIDNAESGGLDIVDPAPAALIEQSADEEVSPVTEIKQSIDLDKTPQMPSAAFPKSTSTVHSSDSQDAMDAVAMTTPPTRAEAAPVSSTILSESVGEHQQPDMPPSTSTASMATTSHSTSDSQAAWNDTMSSVNWADSDDEGLPELPDDWTQSSRGVEEVASGVVDSTAFAGEGSRASVESRDTAQQDRPKKPARTRAKKDRADTDTAMRNTQRPGAMDPSAPSLAGRIQTTTKREPKELFPSSSRDGPSKKESIASKANKPRVEHSRPKLAIAESTTNKGAFGRLTRGALDVQPPSRPAKKESPSSKVDRTSKKSVTSSK